MGNKVFRRGNDSAVILPKDIAFAPGTPVTIERKGDVLTIRPVVKFDPVAEKRKVTELVAALRALGPVGEAAMIQAPGRGLRVMKSDNAAFADPSKVSKKVFINPLASMSVIYRLSKDLSIDAPIDR